jgi:hypothetical protein
MRRARRLRRLDPDPEGDVTYRRVIEHHQRMRHLVEASLAPDDDQAMFMQAEALFRYRFGFPHRSAGSVIAELAASAIDLPMFEAMAGSLDLTALRLRTSDGAIQLCEPLRSLRSRVQARAHGNGSRGRRRYEQRISWPLVHARCDAAGVVRR